MVISLHQCLNRSSLGKAGNFQYSKGSWSSHSTQAQKDTVHVTSSCLTFQTYNLLVSSGFSHLRHVLYSWRFSSLKNLSPQRSIPALRLGAGLHTLSPSVFLRHSVEFSPGTQFILPQTQLEILHPKAPVQILSQGLAVSYLRRDTRAGRAQLEPLVAKQLRTLISFSTGSRRAANSELLKKDCCILNRF